ncbi:FAD-dependent thymidylate synthase [Pelagibacteraceae bacterium]|nr:FAD-dependent thymidylate synthase [Pelagibacteraceae bacterium]
MPVNKEQLEEIEALRAEKTETARVTAPELEAVLYQPIEVLDHGFVRVIDYMGDDSSVVQSARVSYGKGTKKISNDKGLIKYLMRHRHSTPFEMCEIKFHIKLPIFIARQWIRHRTANVNEYSARYSILDKEFYIPSAKNLAAQSQINNQGRGDALTDDEASNVIQILKNDAEQTYANYETLLNENSSGGVLDEGKSGIARELARMNLTLNTYTQWYWKIDLNNLLHFLALRADDHAQYEIRVYADVILDLVKKWVPLTYEAFEDYRMGGTELSAKEIKLMRKLLKGEKVSFEEEGLSKREWSELQRKFDLN